MAFFIKVFSNDYVECITINRGLNASESTKTWNFSQTDLKGIKKET